MLGFTIKEFIRPGTASIFTPREGTPHLCITSAVVKDNKLFFDQGKIRYCSATPKRAPKKSSFGLNLKPPVFELNTTFSLSNQNRAKQSPRLTSSPEITL